MTGAGRDCAGWAIAWGTCGAKEPGIGGAAPPPLKLGVEGDAECGGIAEPGGAAGGAAGGDTEERPGLVML